MWQRRPAPPEDQDPVGWKGKPGGRTMFSFALIGLTVLSPTLTVAADRQRAIPMICAGALAERGRKIVEDNDLPVGRGPNGCFAEADIYHRRAKELIAAEPSTSCPKGRAIDLYSQSESISGRWFAHFRDPICGSDIRFGPSEDGRDIPDLFIDGRRYRDAWGQFAPEKR
jgi:hypothetical protein